MLVIVVYRTPFLSRLCGGEVPHASTDLQRPFLSRLCGGEDTGNDCTRSDFFLSRLCGGEVPNYFF